MKPTAENELTKMGPGRILPETENDPEATPTLWPFVRALPVRRHLRRR